MIPLRQHITQPDFHQRPHADPCPVPVLLDLTVNMPPYPHVFHNPQQQRYIVDLFTCDFDLWCIHAADCTASALKLLLSLCESSAGMNKNSSTARRCT